MPGLLIRHRAPLNNMRSRNNNSIIKITIIKACCRKQMMGAEKSQDKTVPLKIVP
jgi:hypothetical protein